MQETNQQLQLLKNETLPAPIAKNEFDGLQGTISKQANPNALRNTIKVAVLKAFVSHGKAASKEDLTFIINELHTEILRAYSGIRLDEIGLAIHKGAMGEYDKIYNLSLSTFVGFIRSYMQSPERANAAKLYFQSKLLLNTPNRPSDEELGKMKKQNALNAYEFYRVNKYYNDYGNAIIHYLHDQGLVNFTDEQAIEIIKQARSAVFKYYTSPSRSTEERNHKARIVKELRENKEHEFFNTEAKKIGLNFVFKEMVDVGFDLSEALN